MATLVSPGVSVTVTDESFFIPSTAPTVPLFFVATADEKTQPDGTTPAEGTYEYNVVRTVTSLTQSTQLYGIPRFLSDPSTGAPFHGDARNEYGVFALNEFLGLGNQAYVVRANVNLDDNYTDLVSLWNGNVQVSKTLLENDISNFLGQFNTVNGFIPSSPATAGHQSVSFNAPIGSGTSIGSLPSAVYTATITINGVPHAISVDLSTLVTFGDVITAINTQLTGTGVAEVAAASPVSSIVISSATTGSTSTVGIIDGSTHPLFGSLPDFVSILTAVPGTNGFRVTVTPSELLSLVASATQALFASYSFTHIQTPYIADQHLSPLSVYGNGYSNAPTGTYDGLTYIAQNISIFPSYPGGGTVAGEFTPSEGGDLLVATADDFAVTREFLNLTALGANDAARRVAVTTALIATINSNTDVRSENFQYNLILCPGYSECVPALLQLCQDIQEEALVIGDTPNNLSPDGITNPSTGWSASSARVLSNDVAYYYPWGLATNLDGVVVMISPSGIACRTYAFNDNTAFLWFAPAGVRRGLIDPGVTNLGYATGTLGGATTFVETILNQGQRDQLYQYTPSGGINPLVFFPGTGFLIWGQKTSTGSVASALDRVNVSRLVKYIKRSLRINTLPFVFEPNDQLTRDNLKALVDAFLGNLITQRGLYDFATVCDATNNTPDRIDANEMFIDVAIKPVRAAEFIYIPIRVVSTSATI